LKVTYPHLGYLSSPVAYMLRDLNIDVVEPLPISAKTLELGSLHSPADVCLPYKIIMGNFLEGLERGADTFLTSAGNCRGFLNIGQKLALNSKGKIQFYFLDSEHLLPTLYRLLKTIAPTASSLAIMKNITLALKKIAALDAITIAKNSFGAHSRRPAKVIDIYGFGVGEIACCDTLGEVNHVRELVIDIMQSHCDWPVAQPPRVALVGEFYVLQEPFANNWIEDLLIQQGVAVKKYVYSDNWSYAKILLQTLGLPSFEKDRHSYAQPYLNRQLGDIGLKSVAMAACSAQQGYDGIIHIFPESCSTETQVHAALDQISADYNLPLLSLYLDEHTGSSPSLHQLEDFVDRVRH